MPRLTFCPLALTTFATLLVATSTVTAQTRAVSANAVPARCSGVTGNFGAVSAAAKSEAEQLTGRAQAASIQGDNSTATSLYQKAAQLNPSDPSIAYALGREYEITHDARAMREYCRFLALSPAAPEAADVRQRIAELALALPPDTAIVRIPVGAQESMTSPGGAFVGGLFIPGMGQFITHRPVAGFLVLAASAGAAAYGLQSKNVTVGVTRTAIDPLGHSYQYVVPETRSERPNLAVGVGAAAAISLFAAFEAFNHAKSANKLVSQRRADSSLPRSVVPVVSFGTGSVGLGLSLR